MTSPRLLSMAQSAKDITMRNPVGAFKDAIQAGLLSMDETAANYVGDYMYMFTCPVSGDAFKHSGTRQYVYNRKREA